MNYFRVSDGVSQLSPPSRKLKEMNSSNATKDPFVMLSKQKVFKFHIYPDLEIESASYSASFSGQLSAGVLFAAIKVKKFRM